MFRRFAVCALIAAVALSLFPMRSPAASKEIMELQRDVAGLQEQLRLLKESQDKQLAALTVLVQQALDTSKTSTTGRGGNPEQPAAEPQGHGIQGVHAGGGPFHPARRHGSGYAHLAAIRERSHRRR